MLKNYFKIAWRNLGRSKAHSFINIVGLSFGMAVAILIGLWMYDELSYNKNFDNYDHVAQVIQNVSNNGGTWQEYNVSYEQVVQKKSIIQKGSQSLWNFAKALIDESVQKGILKKGE